jgi:Imidazolonepropionase and related amidohydrolases
MKQLLAVAAAISMVGGQAPAPVTVIRAARMIAGNAGTETGPAVVVIRGDRIVSAGSTSQIPDGARIIDLGGATLLPGLIDLHTHLTSTGVHWEEELLKTTPGQAALYGAHNALVTLMAGFTTCRDMGPTWPFTDIDLRKAIDEGVVPGPRLLASGNYISPTWRRRRRAQFSIFVDVPIVRNLADGPDEVRKAVRTNLKQGADFIKILGTGAVLSKGAPPGGQQYSEEEMRVAARKRRAGASTWPRTCTAPPASRPVFAPACTRSITAA